MGASERIGVVGGTGRLGRGLALRLAAAGHAVLIGSRTVARARGVAADLQDRLTGAGRVPAHALEGVSNAVAVARADLVVLAVPYAGVDPLADTLRDGCRGKILVDTVVPLRVEGDEVDVVRPPEGSASLHLRALVPGVTVVAAFKTVPAEVLHDLQPPIARDVLLAGDDADALARIGALIDPLAGLTPRPIGTLARAGLLEGLTALEINLRRRYGAQAHLNLAGLGDH